jgi:hypothetical protein
MDTFGMLTAITRQLTSLHRGAQIQAGKMADQGGDGTQLGHTSFASFATGPVNRRPAARHGRPIRHILEWRARYRRMHDRVDAGHGGDRACAERRA